MVEPLYAPEAATGPRLASDSDLLRDLNPAQVEAVTAPPGPLLVVAGAGTGKTRVLTRRIAWRIAHGTLPRSILAITFTNKAADVLKARLAALPGGADVVAGTFHAFCASVLRRYADRIGGSTDFTILDSEDQHRLVRDVLDDLGISRDVVRPDRVASEISRGKNGAAGREPATREQADLHAAVALAAPAYAERLHAGALYDFDDLLLETRRLLAEAPDARDALLARHRFVLVDEYQDTNGVQADVLKALAGEDRDVTVVGDPDQSIYRWRGATIRNILRFSEEFPGARLVKLETNYRSTKRILAAAEAVVVKNTERYEKRLSTGNPDGERVAELIAPDALGEGRAVVDRLRAWHREGIPWNETAVFYRVNHVSRGVETALRNAGIDYEVVSGVEFYERREVKDLLAYARLLENPRDEAAFSRIANVPRRGVGATTLERVRAVAVASRTSLPEAAASKVEGVSGKARAGLDALLGCLARLRALPRSPVAPVFQAIAAETRYREDLLSKEDDLERSRVENVDELIAAAREADRQEPGLTLRRFLERTTLASDQDGWDPTLPRVSLMTVHAAKGLEFDGVIVLGAEEGWFPHARNAARASDVEEERRLFYVAMTRARKRLAVTIARQRDAWQGPEARTPSRFWLDVPDALVTTHDARGLYDRARARREAGYAHDVPDDDPADRVAEAPPAETSIARGDDGVPKAGESVRHPFFGRGRMLSRSGSGEGLRVKVEFEDVGTKDLLWTYARLERVGGASAPEGDAS